MADEREIELAIQKLAGTYLKDIVSIVMCNVISVNEEKRTCDCKPISGDAVTDIPSVQLMAEANNGFVVFPAVGSSVIVAYSTRGTAFVIMYSDLSSVVFFDGSFGGLTKTLELKTQIDKLNEQLQAVISSLTDWTPVGGDGGAALKTYFATQIAGKDPGDFTNIENGLITHGE